MMDRSQRKGRSSKPAGTAWLGRAFISPMTPINPFTAYVRNKWSQPSLFFPLYLFAPSHPHNLPGALGLQRWLPRLKDPFSEMPKNCTANFLITLSHHQGQQGRQTWKFYMGADRWFCGQRSNYASFSSTSLLLFPWGNTTLMYKLRSGQIWGYLTRSLTDLQYLGIPSATDTGISEFC